MLKSSPLLSKDNTAWFLFLLTVIIFIGFKIPQLSLPHYWDEAWSYSTAVHAMYDAGPSLLPGKVDPEFTRGHPLLFYFLSTSWMSIFGPSILSKHIFALVISLLTIFSVFFIGNRLSQNKWIGLLSAVVLMLQPMFFVQSAMLLPEVMVALFALWSIYAFAFKKWTLLTISLSLVLLTKESGFMVYGALGLLGLIQLFVANKSERRAIIASFTIPGLVIASFFTYQYYVHGWFLFPSHIGMIKLTIKYVGGNLAYILTLNDFRFLSIFIAVAALIVFWKDKYLDGLIVGFIPLAFLIIASIKSIFKGHANGFVVWAFAILLLLAIIIIVKKWNSLAVGQRFFAASLLFSMFYIAFSACNFFTIRYLMPYTMILTLGAAYQIFKLVESVHFKWIYISIVPILGSLWLMLSQKGFGDTQIGAFKAISVQNEIIQYMLQEVPKDAKIAWGSFQMSVNMQNPACGFIPNQEAAFQQLDWTIDSITQYFLVDNIEPDARLKDVVEGGFFDLVYEAKRGDTWARLYKVKN